MSRESPFRFGIRRVARDPVLLLAEIGWRWTFGSAALAILFYASGRLLATTHLSDGQVLALNSGTPVLIADAVAHILEEARPRFMTAVAIVLPALVVLWTIASAVGRAATLKPLLRKSALSMRAMFGLSFLRASLALAGVLAWMAAFIVAGQIAAQGEVESPGAFLVVFLLLSLLISTAWGMLNWYLSLAPVFAVRDGSNTLGSIAQAVRVARENRNAFSAVSGVFSLLHLVALVSGTFVALMPLGLVGALRSGIVLALMGLVMLGYFVVADFLYIARLAAYVRIVVEADRASAEIIPPRAVISPPSAGSAIDNGIQLRRVEMPSHKLIAWAQSF